MKKISAQKILDPTRYPAPKLARVCPCGEPLTDSHVYNYVQAFRGDQLCEVRYLHEDKQWCVWRRSVEQRG